MRRQISPLSAQKPGTCDDSGIGQSPDSWRPSHWTQTNVPVIRFETREKGVVSEASAEAGLAAEAEAVRGEGVYATSGTIIRTTAAAKR
jgi:hypothetical protein